MLTNSQVWHHSGKKQLSLQHRGLEVSFATQDRAETVLYRYIYTCPKKALWDTCGTRLELFWSRAQTYGKSAWPRSRTTCMDRGDRPPYALLPLQLLSRHYVRPEPTLRIYMHMLLPVRPQPFARMTSLLLPPWRQIRRLGPWPRAFRMRPPGGKVARRRNATQPLQTRDADGAQVGEEERKHTARLRRRCHR